MMIQMKCDYKKNIFFIYLISRCIYIFIIIHAIGFNFNIEEIYSFCDNEHYITIAQNGYTEKWQTAFFPLIPFLIRTIGIKGVFIVNQIASILSMYILESLTEDTYAVELFAFSVNSFFSLMLYTESLLFFFTILGYYMFKRRYLDVRLGIIIGLCVFTKAIGAMIYITIFIGMIILYLQDKLKKRSFVEVFLPATVISCIYPVYLQITFGNWKLFIDCQYDYWKRIKINFIQEILIQIKFICSNARHIYKINEILSLIMVIFILYQLIYYIYNYLEKESFCDMIILVLYTLFSIISINATIRIPVNDAPTTSFYRYYYCIFPIFIFASKLKKYPKEGIYICSNALSFGAAYLFSKNFYFY